MEGKKGKGNEFDDYLNTAVENKKRLKELEHEAYLKELYSKDYEDFIHIVSSIMTEMIITDKVEMKLWAYEQKFYFYINLNEIYARLKRKNIIKNIRIWTDVYHKEKSEKDIQNQLNTNYRHLQIRLCEGCFSSTLIVTLTHYI
jgi:hypothetical protein